jgi:hypothetical protein
MQEVFQICHSIKKDGVALLRFSVKVGEFE